MEINLNMNQEKLVHELTIWPQFFSRIADGSKTFEVRDNSRGFQFGDDIIFKEYDGFSRKCTGRFITAKVGFVYFMKNSKYCVFSILDKSNIREDINV